MVSEVHTRRGRVRRGIKAGKVISDKGWVHALRQTRFGPLGNGWLDGCYEWRWAWMPSPRGLNIG